MASTMNPETGARTALADTAPAGNKRSFALPIVVLLVLVGLGWAGKTYLYNRVHESTEVR